MAARSKARIPRFAAAIVGALITAVVLASPVPAQAATVESMDMQQEPHGHANAEVWTARMALNCANMSPEAWEYAVDHSLCTPEGTAVDPIQSDDIRPMDDVWGDCGGSWIYVWDDPNSTGRMGTYYGFVSTEGTVIYRNLSIGWTNWSSGSTGSSGDSGVMASSEYNNERTLSTGRGSVFATLSGTVTLWWGGQCVLLVPSDSTVVV